MQKYRVKDVIYENSEKITSLVHVRRQSKGVGIKYSNQDDTKNNYLKNPYPSPPSPLT